MEALLTGYGIFTVLLIILAIAWIILPFAMIGTKPLLKELIKQTKETNRLLSQQQPK
jgi:uncharacterized protein YoxC